MISYFIKRIAMAILTLFIVITITFFLMYLIPGGPFLSEKAPSQATLNALNEKYGLDLPVYLQYKNYIINIAKGDFGVSLKQRGRDVLEIIKTGFPVSAKLGGISILLALLIGLPLGCIAAFKRGKFIDSFIMFFSTLAVAVPTFVIAAILMYIFSNRLGILPSFGLLTPMHYILPVISLSLYPTAYISRLMRSSMLDILGQEYMKTARAKGLSHFKCIFKHALKNAIIPIITYLGPLIAYMVTGSFVIEKIFTIPGLGNEFISSIIARDYPLIMGTTIFLAFLLILINVVVDIIYTLVDPRISLR